MNQWWEALSGPLHVFYLIALVGCLLLFIQVLVMLLGFDHLDAHADAAGDGAGEHAAGLKFLSIRTITAFCVGMGWTGVILLGTQLGIIPTVLIASVIGALLAWSVMWLMSLMRRLSSDGSLDYANAVQQTGTVIVSIQAQGRTGGQIEIMIQGRLAVVNAVGATVETTIPPGTKVRVIGLADQTTLRVAPV